MARVCSRKADEGRLRAGVQQFVERASREPERTYATWVGTITRRLGENTSLRVDDLAGEVGRHPSWLGNGLNCFAAAVPFLRKAVELDPGDILTPYMLALVLSDLGDVSQASQVTDDILMRWPDDVYANSLSAVVHLLRGNKEAAVRYAQKSLELDPQQLSGYTGSPMTLTYADLERKDYLTARARCVKASPQLLSPEAPINRANYRYAIDLATILQQTGEGKRADLLLDRSEQVIRTMARLGDGGYGIADVRIDTLRGNKTKALTAVREAATTGWRGPLWRYYRKFDPALASIRDEPEFKAVFADIERDMAEQRARLGARHKDAPCAPRLRGNLPRSSHPWPHRWSSASPRATTGSTS